MTTPLPTQDVEKYFLLPALERLAEHLLDLGISQESTGFLLGRITRDLWDGAASEMIKELSEEEQAKIKALDDPVEKIRLLTELYSEKTDTDALERLSAAADKVANLVINTN